MIQMVDSAEIHDYGLGIVQYNLFGIIDETRVTTRQ